MSLRLFQSLLLKASRIQQKIDDEYKARWPDQFRLLRLKKIRLMIKDRLLSLFSRPFNMRAKQAVRIRIPHHQR